jgi:hypothetical protein
MATADEQASDSRLSFLPKLLLWSLVLLFGYLYLGAVERSEQIASEPETVARSEPADSESAQSAPAPAAAVAVEPEVVTSEPVVSEPVAPEPVMEAAAGGAAQARLSRG